jgi:hypothetical protein
MSISDRARTQRAPILPERVRRIERGFAVIPNRFLHGGFLASLTHAERSLYLFLVLAGDRNGVSFYAYDRICSTLEMTLDDYLVVRNRLIERDLIAFDGTRFQVLSLPDQPVVPVRPPLRTEEDFDTHDPATIRQLVDTSFNER